MNQAAIIKATFSDFRLIKGRKQAQLVFELPLELADEALRTMGGLPRSDAERWFAIARLDPKAAVTAEPTTERRRFNTLPLPQQIALRCGDVNFQQFLEVNSESDAAQIVRTHCRVNSRSEIQPDTKAAAAWQSLDNEFYAYQHGGVR